MFRCVDRKGVTTGAFKEYFNKDFYRSLAAVIETHYPGFAADEFFAAAVDGLDSLELKQRLKRTAVVCRQFLPDDYREAASLLSEIAPKIYGTISGMFIPEFVGLYGLQDFVFSLEALRQLTKYSSSEFAVREFLRHDFDTAICEMYKWSEDEDHHVRRLSSEGSRPRLPWSFQLKNLMEDPSPTVPILENLKADPEEYVRRSVSNHLNDMSKDHPDFMLDLVGGWDLTEKHTAWIARRAARSLIKAGYPRAFALFGFESKPQIEISPLMLSRTSIIIGEELIFSFKLKSGSRKSQKLAVDYAVHYVKKSGKTSRKVFKLKELELGAQEEIEIVKKQSFADVSIRTHNPGTHLLEILVNGNSEAMSEITLKP